MKAEPQASALTPSFASCPEGEAASLRGVIDHVGNHPRALCTELWWTGGYQDVREQQIQSIIRVQPRAAIQKHAGMCMINVLVTWSCFDSRLEDELWSP